MILWSTAEAVLRHSKDIFYVFPSLILWSTAEAVLRLFNEFFHK